MNYHHLHHRLVNRIMEEVTKRLAYTTGVM